jgi:apyrase
VGHACRSGPAVANTASPITSAKPKVHGFHADEDRTYAVVFDAGSTGSRVHIFEFQSQDGQLVLLKDTFEQLKPGLGDACWAADPEASAASLQPLIAKATTAIPRDKQADTPVELRATAGLRLLPGSQADAILAAVTLVLRGTPFKLLNDGVSIMDGADEGAFAWLTLNYLLGKAGKPAKELVGAVDLGGGSVQQAFAVDEATARDAPKGAPPAAPLLAIDCQMRDEVLRTSV